MIDHLIDTNVLSQVFRGNIAVKNFVESLDGSVDATVYVECMQGSKSNQEKHTIKKYLSRFPIFHHNRETSKKTIALIEQYSNSHGLMLPDAQIAAVCLVRELTLVTYNITDFRFIPEMKLLTPNV